MGSGCSKTRGLVTSRLNAGKLDQRRPTGAELVKPPRPRRYP